MKVCNQPECTKPTGVPGTSKESGFCQMHYNRWLRNGDPNIKTQRVIQKKLPCSYCKKPRAGNGLCATHWMQNKRRGDPLAPPLHPPNWTAKEDTHLYAIMNRTPDGLGKALPYEVMHLEIILKSRTPSAIRTRLHTLRKKRKAAQNQAIVAKS